jgi:hypothetical protein
MVTTSSGLAKIKKFFLYICFGKHLNKGSEISVITAIDRAQKVGMADKKVA